MKYFIAFILLFVFPILSYSQPTSDSVESADSDSTLITNLFTELKASWNLGLIGDIGDPVDIRVFNKFKSLFTNNATIDDEFNAKYEYNESTKRYEYMVHPNKPFNEYAHDIITEVGKLSIDKVLDEKVEPTNLLQYKIYREITAYKKRPSVLDTDTTYFNTECRKRNVHLKKEDSITVAENNLYHSPNSVYEFITKDTLLITLEHQNNIYKISRIARILHDTTITCSNDKDQDGVLIGEDKDDNRLGDFTAFGLPDTDFDGVENDSDDCKKIFGLYWNHGCPVNYFTKRFSAGVSAGVMLNVCNIDMPQLSNAGYTNLDMDLSKKGKMESSGLRLGLFIGPDVSYYVGKTKHKGLSIGVNYSSFSSIYKISEDAVYVFKENDGFTDYRRKITLLKGSKEEIRYSIWNIPLLFKYRTRFNSNKDEKKLYVEFSAGPSLMYFKNSSDYNLNMNIEGLYQIDTINQDKFTYYDYFDKGSTWNVSLTANGIDSQSTSPGAAAIFNQLNAKTYDFASSKNYSGTDNEAKRFSFALNASVDFCYQINSFSFKFGATVAKMVTPFPSDYQPLNKTTDTYNSLFRSKTNLNFMSFGIHIGCYYCFLKDYGL